jgi:Flp pilus assembly protein TadG
MTGVLIPLRRRFDSDRGAIAVMVAVLFSTGILLGFVALVVDVGLLYSEREQSISGADAAARTLAITCANSPTTCGSASDVTRAGNAASADAPTGKTSITSVQRPCVRYAVASMPTCTGTTKGNQTDCYSPTTALTAGVNYVEVRTNTTVPDSTVLPVGFASTLVPGYKGPNVGACARVAWAAADKVPNTTGLSFAQCDLPTTLTSVKAGSHTEQIIFVHDGTGRTGHTCGSATGGNDAPGGFGFVSTNTACTLTTTAGSTVTFRDDTPPSNGCLNAVYNAWQSQDYVLVPIYSKVATHNMATGTATLVGVGAFVITGYQLGNGGGMSHQTEQSWQTGRTTCGTGHATDRCVFGYFGWIDLQSGASLGSGVNLGVNLFKTVG